MQQYLESKQPKFAPRFFKTLFLLVATLCLGGVFLTSSQAYALQPLSAFLAAAKKNSFDVRIAIATAQQRNDEWVAALGRLLPSLSASGTYTRNSYGDFSLTSPVLDSSNNPIIDPNTGKVLTTTRQVTAQHQVTGLFNINVPLIDVASIQRARAAKVNEQAAKLRTESTYIEVQKNIAKTYFQYIAAAALVGSSDRALLAAQENQQIAGTKLLAGTASQLDVERAKADTERARQIKADAELTQILAGRMIETLTGISPEGPAATLDDDLHSEASLSDWETRVGYHPSVKAAQADIRAAWLNANGSWWALAPTLAASFNGQQTNVEGLSGQNSSWNLGVSLVWRFDLTSVFTAKSLNTATSIAKIHEEQTRRAAQDDIFNTWNQVKTYIVRSQAARAQVTASLKALELAQVRYKAGMATQLEVSQAERDRLSAEANRIQTDADLAYSRILLRLDTAQPVEYDK